MQQQKSPLAILLLILVSFFPAAGALAADKTFQIDGHAVPVGKDGIHDPKNEAAAVLQNPKDAMSAFPRDGAGIIDWVKALEQQKIIARSNIQGTATTKPLDLDIVMPKTGKEAKVKFTHRAHTELFTCNNCHTAIFQQKAGVNDNSMARINQGQSCGVCHGKVAFPAPKNCARCHNQK